MAGDSARKGLILAGGNGTRLYPITQATGKQLLPLYDKPMIYYPLSTLMLAGIRDIAVISTPRDLPVFRSLLGTGAQWGVRLCYIEQPSPDGLAQAYLLARGFLGGAASALVLGDNVFLGGGLKEKLRDADRVQTGGMVFGYDVARAGQYGVIEFGGDGRILSIVEKPETPRSSTALTGLYFLDGDASTLADEVRPSHRGELEITDLLNLYLSEGKLSGQDLTPDIAWFDSGTPDSLLDAAACVRAEQRSLGRKLCCPEEIALANGWITIDALVEWAAKYLNTPYGHYLQSLCEGRTQSNAGQER